MKVRFLINAIEGGVYYKIGDIADIPESRVQDYGPYVEVVEEEKTLNEPPKDKMIRHAKKK
ncbi:MAG: hypothetical protein GX452_13750 [Ignavibacteriales bacterium]|nr:hypothetical protein [Ignavibacteriales bacterium]